MWLPEHSSKMSGTSLRETILGQRVVSCRNRLQVLRLRQSFSLQKSYIFLRQLSVSVKACLHNSYSSFSILRCSNISEMLNQPVLQAITWLYTLCRSSCCFSLSFFSILMKLSKLNLPMEANSRSISWTDMCLQREAISFLAVECSIQNFSSTIFFLQSLMNFSFSDQKYSPSSLFKGLSTVLMSGYSYLLAFILIGVSNSLFTSSFFSFCRFLVRQKWTSRRTYLASFWQPFEISINSSKLQSLVSSSDSQLLLI